MADYYSILGIRKTASDLEIKSAFRSLAKIYHPDKNPDNPEAKALFQNILKAYNVLIDPVQRRRYDYSLSFGTSYTSSQGQKQQPGRKKHKEWNFTEEELQKRQYYQKYYKAKQQQAQMQQSKPTYSDYKYVLFATPIAVALLMLVVSFFSPDPDINVSNTITKPSDTPEVTVNKRPDNGYTPYSGYFGSIKTYQTSNTLQINNASPYDAVVVLFDRKDKHYLQHAYLQSSYFIEFSKLPDDGVYWKCMLGKNWNETKVLFNNKISGGFDSIVQFQTNLADSNVVKQGEKEMEILSVINAPSNNQHYISNDIEFFKR